MIVITRTEVQVEKDYRFAMSDVKFHPNSLIVYPALAEKLMMATSRTFMRVFGDMSRWTYRVKKVGGNETNMNLTKSNIKCIDRFSDLSFAHNVIEHVAITCSKHLLPMYVAPPSTHTLDFSSHYLYFPSCPSASGFI